jgi:hypothetical protein
MGTLSFCTMSNMFLQARKGCCQLGKAYYDGINVHISGITVLLALISEGNKLGRCLNICFPTSGSLISSIKEKGSPSPADTLFKESFITEVQVQSVLILAPETRSSLPYQHA